MKCHFGGDGNKQHQCGEERTGRGMVSGLKKLRSGKYPIANVEGIKKSCRKANADTGGKFDSTSCQSVSVRIARKANQMFSTNVGREQRRADQRPRQTSISEKKMSAIERRLFADG